MALTVTQSQAVAVLVSFAGGRSATADEAADALACLAEAAYRRLGAGPRVLDAKEAIGHLADQLADVDRAAELEDIAAGRLDDVLALRADLEAALGRAAHWLGQRDEARARLHFAHSDPIERCLREPCVSYRKEAQRG